jgi:hypothetical protein
MSPQPLDLLIDAFSIDGTCYVLGAGASSPHVPTMAQLSERLASYATRLSSFPTSRLPDSPLRRLIAPMIDQALTATTLDGWKPLAMTPATIAIALEHLIATAHWLPLPQYAVFRLIPQSSSVVSFNWDGLARARVHQTVVLHPHGTIRPRFVLSAPLDELFDLSQNYEPLDARDWLVPGLVMPGEEESPHLASTREAIFEIWCHAPQVIIIGYSFGPTSSLDYDRVWLDTFAEAFRVNTQATIHLIAPNALWLRGELVERLKRTVNVHAWPLNWHAFACALLHCARLRNSARIAELRIRLDTLDRLYHAAVERTVGCAA